jgi:hypothetical protein
LSVRRCRGRLWEVSRCSWRGPFVKEEGSRKLYSETNSLFAATATKVVGKLS